MFGVGKIMKIEFNEVRSVKLFSKNSNKTIYFGNTFAVLPISWGLIGEHSISINGIYLSCGIFG
jgi:hypothetical protein